MLFRNWTGNLLVFNIVEVSFIFRSAPGRSVGFSEIGASMPTAWKSFSEGLARSSVPRAYPGTLPSKSATLKAVESVSYLPFSSPVESAAHDEFRWSLKSQIENSYNPQY